MNRSEDTQRQGTPTQAERSLCLQERLTAKMRLMLVDWLASAAQELKVRQLGRVGNQARCILLHRASASTGCCLKIALYSLKRPWASQHTLDMTACLFHMLSPAHLHATPAAGATDLLPGSQHHRSLPGGCASGQGPISTGAGSMHTPGDQLNT